MAEFLVPLKKARRLERSWAEVFRNEALPQWRSALLRCTARTTAVPTERCRPSSGSTFSKAFNLTDDEALEQLDIAGRWKNRRVGGPGMRALAMVILFFPVMLVAMAAPGTLGRGRVSSTWSAVSLTLMGVLLSAVISEPLRRFLLEWGNLMPDGEPVPKL